MLSKEDREQKEISYSPFTIQSIKERTSLFPHCNCGGDIFKECIEAYKEPNKSVIINDERDGVSSTHICIFVNDAGHLINLPLKIQESFVHFLRIQNTKRDFLHPNYFINKYNEIGKERGMDKLNLVVKNNNI